MTLRHKRPKKTSVKKKTHPEGGYPVWQGGGNNTGSELEGASTKENGKGGKRAVGNKRATNVRWQKQSAGEESPERNIDAGNDRVSGKESFEPTEDPGPGKKRRRARKTSSGQDRKGAKEDWSLFQTWNPGRISRKEKPGRRDSL